MSPYALLTGAILVLLAAPLIWMAGRVARDHALAGGGFVVGIGLLMLALRPHLGSRLPDITFGVLCMASLALMAATLVGLGARRRDASKAAPRSDASLPPARVLR